MIYQNDKGKNPTVIKVYFLNECITIFKSTRLFFLMKLYSINNNIYSDSKLS